MTQYNNPHMNSEINPEFSGALYIDRQLTNLNDPLAWPAAIVNADQVQIGVVPAGCVLVPELSAFIIPQLDGNAAPTGNYTIGTAASGTALVSAAKSAGAAQIILGAALPIAALIGDPFNDTPIYLYATSNFATPEVTGKIFLDLAMRAWRKDVDGPGSGG